MIENFGFALLRSPLQSIDKAYQLDNESSELFKEGLYLSSPEFWMELQRKDDLSAAEQKKLTLSYAKYHSRSCSRCTPYGTFAGSLVVTIADSNTEIELEKAEMHEKKIRVDMNYMTEIIDALVNIPEVKRQLKFFPNNSLYELAESFRYVQYAIKNNQRNYNLTSVEKTNYLASILVIAKEGKTLSEMADFLSETEKTEKSESEEFLDDLIRSQILISDLEPYVTGEEPLDNLLKKIHSLNGLEQIKHSLLNIKKLINTPFSGVNGIKQIENALKNLNDAIAVPKNTLQADLFLVAKTAVLNEAIVNEITIQADDLTVLSKMSQNRALEEFKSKFAAKYDLAEVPLNIALDGEIGIGYANIDQISTGLDHMLNDLAVGSVSQQSSYQIDTIQQFALSKYLDYIENTNDYIELSEQDLEGLKNNTTKHRFSNTFFIMGSLIKKNDNFNAKDFTFDLQVFAGPSAGHLLARFTHGNADLCEKTRNALKLEDEVDANVMVTELAHFPQARMGNVLLRPILRQYEIPYVGRSGINIENQVEVADILVSIVGNEVVLRSRRLNKRISPRLTTAHNFVYKGLPLYRFLGDLQSQNQSHPVLWDWGLLNSRKHLPRVIYKNLILKKEQWKIEENDIKDIPAEFSGRIDFLNALRNKMHIHDKVVMVEADNKLLIDFTNEYSTALFINYLKKNKSILIEEFLFNKENCIVKNTNGESFTNELIIPLFRKSQVSPVGSKAIYPGQAIKRKFLPSSEWVYFKIYAGPKMLEKLLKNNLYKLISANNTSHLFEKCFFLRFVDPDHHLRIRFYNSDISKQVELSKMFISTMQPLNDAGIIDKIVIDTYAREIERYGAEFIEDVETIFYHDSVAALGFIELLEDEDQEKYRILFAMRGVDSLMDDFVMQTEDKLILIKIIQKDFFKEFGAGNVLEKQLNDKYRKEQKDIFSHMNADLDVINDFDVATDLLKARSSGINTAVKSIIKHINGDQVKSDDIVRSLMHMFLNRLFIVNQRKTELVIYHFLERFYTSFIAIQKKNSNTSAGQIIQIR